MYINRLKNKKELNIYNIFSVYIYINMVKKTKKTKKSKTKVVSDEVEEEESESDGLSTKQMIAIVVFLFVLAGIGLVLYYFVYIKGSTNETNETNGPLGAITDTTTSSSTGITTSSPNTTTAAPITTTAAPTTTTAPTCGVGICPTVSKTIPYEIDGHYIGGQSMIDNIQEVEEKTYSFLDFLNSDAGKNYREAYAHAAGIDNKKIHNLYLEYSQKNKHVKIYVTCKGTKNCSNSDVKSFVIKAL